MSEIQPVFIGGRWRPASSDSSFTAVNPQTGEPLAVAYPVSDWIDCNEALEVAASAFRELNQTSPDRLGDFLDAYAGAIENNSESLVAAAVEETGLPSKPRLADVELPRTTGQLRQAATAARDGSWRLPTIDAAANIRSYFAGMGPVLIIGPNNFPLAFNSVSGGDFAAAVAAGNPIIAKAHPSHPRTTQLLFQLAVDVAAKVGLPNGALQLLYHVAPESGLAMVEDPRLGATAFTGSRQSGLALKAAADAAGKPIYLEMSSLNPVVITPAALQERSDEIADQFCTSCTMAAGQFCTNPGLLLLVDDPATQKFVASIQNRLAAIPVGCLFSQAVRDSLQKNVQLLTDAGATLVVGGKTSPRPGIGFENTLLQVTADQFLAQPELFQTEMFGASSLAVIGKDFDQIEDVVNQLHGSLTGTIYTSQNSDSTEKAAYRRVADALRPKVGRLINDKMPTGVAVSPAMHHGGPFPSTGHPGFTAVGIPGALRRFCMLQCFDNVAEDRLPEILRDKNPGMTWRLIDGHWTQSDALSPAQKK